MLHTVLITYILYIIQLYNNDNKNNNNNNTEQYIYTHYAIESSRFTNTISQAFQESSISGRPCALQRGLIAPSENWCMRWQPGNRLAQLAGTGAAALHLLDL
jgi:predicted nucleotide-binding protein (sugar kinase/HSP70/actin superfamily)